MSAVWPGRRINSTPGTTSRVALDELPLPGFFHGLEIFGEIAGAIAFGGRLGVLEFAAMHDIARIRKHRHGLPIHDARVPAAMIEVQMRVHHDIDLLGRHAVGTSCSGRRGAPSKA